MDPVVLGALTAAVGAVTTYVIRRAEIFVSNRKRKGLEGTWLSLSGSQRNGPVADEIDIRITFFGIELRNKSRPHGYDYRAVGRLVENRFIYGSWKSLRPGATAGGSFQFFISEQGDAMVGAFTGQADHGSFMNAWILGRNAHALKRAQELLQAQPLALPA